MKNVCLPILIVLTIPTLVFGGDAAEFKVKRQKIAYKGWQQDLVHLLETCTPLGSIAQKDNFPVIDYVLDYAEPSWQEIGSYAVGKISYQKKQDGLKALCALFVVKSKNCAYWQKLLPRSVCFSQLDGIHPVISLSNRSGKTKEYISQDQSYKIAARQGMVTVYRYVF